MSEMRPDVDLSALARAEPGAERIPRPRRFHPLWLLPLLVGLAFVGVVLSSLDDLFAEVHEVSVVRPRASTASARVGSVILQAAGWVEPDPFPSQVSALTGGVVAEVLVQESEAVERDQVVARLVDDDRRLELELARAATAAARAQLEDAEAEAVLAEEQLQAGLAVEEELAAAEAMLAAHAQECAHAEAQVEAAAARLEVARAELETQRFLSEQDASGPWQVELAASLVEQRQAEHRAAQHHARRSVESMRGTTARVQRARQERELRLADRTRAARAQGERALRRSRLQEAEANESLARQRLDWCEVRAPVAGVVLERRALPGSALGMEGERSVCTLYDPRRLRIRVDVPQADVGRLGLGLDALIQSSARPETAYHGRVLRIVQRADIQKVTLEVQVEVLDEDEALRPEMLCQVRFLAGGEEEPADESESERVLLVPRALVDGETLWVLDPSGERAQRRRVSLGARQGDLVEVREGLDLSDKIIERGRDGLEDGDRVQVRQNP